jgi:hypothetical protein
MQFSFDLISDLHVESWDQFDWSDKPTSPYCVVAGDIARDRQLVVDTLSHLGTVYAGVLHTRQCDHNQRCCYTCYQWLVGLGL